MQIISAMHMHHLPWRKYKYTTPYSYSNKYIGVPPYCNSSTVFFPECFCVFT